jgi:glycosyltransferase involved in cell wall biosynthesis
MEDSQKKYLLISPDFPPPNIGGSKVWLLNLVENSGLKFDILTCKKSETYDEILIGQHNIIRSRYIFSSSDPSKFQLILTYLYIFLFSFFCIKNKYAGVLVNPGIIGNGLVILVAKILSFKVIVAGHGEEITVPLYSKNIKNFFKKKFMIFTYKKADGFFVVCDFCRRLLISMGVEADKVEVIPSCINPDKIKQNRLKKIKTYNLISVGRLIERKGFHFLIQSVAKLKTEISDIKLNIVGDGPYFKICKNLIDKFEAHDYIKLYGEISDEDLSNLYSKSDLFILAHTMLKNGDTEGCPTVFSEAMANNLPVIGGTGAGADTAIIDNYNGYIVNSKDIDSISNAIRKILNNDDVYYRMVNNCKIKLSKDHNPKINGNIFGKFVKKITS